MKDQEKGCGASEARSHRRLISGRMSRGNWPQRFLLMANYCAMGTRANLIPGGPLPSDGRMRRKSKAEGKFMGKKLRNNYCSFSLKKKSAVCRTAGAFCVVLFVLPEGGGQLFRKCSKVVKTF